MSDAVKRVEEFFAGFIPNEKIHNRGPLPGKRSSLDVEDVRAILDELSKAKVENERLRDALSPSCETKSAYIGEFSFGLQMWEEGEDIRIGRNTYSVDKFGNIVSFVQENTDD